MKLLPDRISKAVFCLCLLVASAAIADDYHYVNMLVGTRASGLGGAYTAVSDDPAGCYYNPAGIAFAAHSSLSASVNTFTTSRKTYKGALLGVSGGELDWDQETFDLLPNFFGTVRKFGSGMLGFSYAVPDSTQRRQKQKFTNIASTTENNDIETYTINMNDTDKTYLFGPTYAYAFSDSFSVGATLYVYYRDMQNIRNELVEFEGGEHVLINQYETKTAWGYKPILGTTWEPLDKLAIGLSVSKIYVTTSDYETQTVQRNTVNPGNDENTDTHVIHIDTSTSDEKDKFPLCASLGVAYFATPRLLLSGDIRYYEKVSDKESTYNLALGTEYYFTDSLAVRAGLFTDRANTPELTSGNQNQPEHINIYGGSLSLSLFHRMSSITLGMSYAYGKGNAQVQLESDAIQTAEITNLTVYIAASYRY